MRVHFTPYWALVGGHGCVERGAGRLDTGARTAAPAMLRVVIRFSLARIFSRGPSLRLTIV